MMKEEVKAAGAGMLDFGSDTLHVAHNAFEKGLDQFLADIPILAKSIHGFFKYSTIRREKFSLEISDVKKPEAFKILPYMPRGM